MSLSRSFAIALSFVGLLVGAGFASGQEVVQYFVSYGSGGIWGMVIAGGIMTLAGTVFLQLGSYFQATEHNAVFTSVTHPNLAKILDVCVIITLFAVGFVMFAGAGANLNQQFGIKTWIGSFVMLLLVIVSGMLDVDKVSRVIGAITPLIIIAVVFVGIYSLMHLPDSWSHVFATAKEIPSPIPNWWIAALNYSGLSLILAVSMTLVIGGDNSNPSEAGLGGILGGLIYSIMLVIALFSLFVNIDAIKGTDMPLLAVVDSISPVLGVIMAIIIYLMIYNTAIGMFYALGKRMSASRPDKYKEIFIGGCVLGFAVSFAGFKTLMQYVYPVLGYLGIALVIVLVLAWIKNFSKIKDEAERRARLNALLRLRLNPGREYTKKHQKELTRIMKDSVLEDEDLEELYETALTEASEALDQNEDVEFDLEKFEPEEFPAPEKAFKHSESSDNKEK